MPHLKGLIFDLDGTLLDSAPDLRQALNLTLKAGNRRELNIDEVKDLTGDGLMPLLGRAFKLTGEVLSEVEIYQNFQQFINFYRDVKPDVAQIYPQAVEMIGFYKKSGIKIGLCTNKQEEATLRLLEELDIKNYFDFVAGGDTFPYHKPHPEHVSGVARKLGVANENCVMIGDSRNDILAAKAANVPCLLVTHGYGSDLDSLSAGGFIRGFKDLPKALEKLGFNLV